MSVQNLRPHWPDGLPNYVEKQTYREAAQFPLDRFEPYEGPPIDMPKGTFDIDEIDCTLIMTSDQVDILRRFVRVDLMRNSLPFTGTHPRTRVQAEMKLLNSPAPFEISHRGGREFTISIKLLVIA